MTINRLLLGVHYYSLTHLRWSDGGQVLDQDERILSLAEELANQFPRPPTRFRDALPRMIQDVTEISSPKKGKQYRIYFKTKGKMAVYDDSERNVIRKLASYIMVGSITSSITTLTYVHSLLSELFIFR